MIQLLFLLQQPEVGGMFESSEATAGCCVPLAMLMIAMFVIIYSWGRSNS